MSLIVVEGVDASGKSTLLETSRLEIKKRYFVLVRHSCRPLELGDALQFMRMVNGSSQYLDVIADRHPLISEPIYGTIIRDGHLFANHFNYDNPEYRANTLSSSVDRIIYCRPPVEVMREHIDKNPQLEWVKERFDQLVEAYDETMSYLQDEGVDVVWHDWTTYLGTLENLFFGKKL